MKRVYVYKNQNDKIGKIMAMENTIEGLKSKISQQFKLTTENFKLFSNGCEIVEIEVIKDDDRIYLCFDSNEEAKDCEEIENSMRNLHVSGEGASRRNSNASGESSSQQKSNEMDVSASRRNLNVSEESTSHGFKGVSDWITLNVGGKHFTTSRGTLLAKEPQSMLARMFADDNNVYLMNPSEMDSTGAYMIDRSPEYFEPILNYLRHGNVILDNNVNPRGVMEEAVFYGIDSMIPQLTQMIEESRNSSGSYQALTRMDVVRSIIITSTSSELRFQGVNLCGADLNRLDLRFINFKYAYLSRCNLSGANLSYCCLERADLSYANLEGAQLLGVKALCANMEGANLKGCNMEDPVGSRAIMEGVNLKGVQQCFFKSSYVYCSPDAKQLPLPMDTWGIIGVLLTQNLVTPGANLEGSNMAGVNLRVATLKNANLQNCDLRAAVLAGADLECCDLSGSDLHEANLRGANLKDAAFELMLTPLHMSQTIR